MDETVTSATALPEGDAPAEAAALLPPIRPQDVEQQTTAIVDFLTVGGPVLWLLATLSVVMMALVLAKLIQFSIARMGSHARGGGLGIIKTATQNAIETHDADRSFAEDAGRRAARTIMRPLEGGLGTLGMIAMLSPLIGLLGTVIGMIGAFQALENAASTVDPSRLSGGIWIALLTTAAGLVVAIPATLAHGWFEGRLTRFADEAECLIGESLAQAAPIKNPLRMAAE
ncbi:MotA/TolQ/ExbB proton channel family protein [Pyruvatibacter sp.]|uniref:MotA/TolQ/ExbB proton channel family protein n=1 Tax=Pyruvatibacter sp. TaxID=1981328 RepID=UPI003265B990